MMPAAETHVGARIAHISQIPEGEGRLVKVAGLCLAVFNTRSGVFATEPTCPHLNGPLADGLTGSHTIMCPLHDRVYDLCTGEGVNTDSRIVTYPVTVEPDGTIVIAA